MKKAILYILCLYNIYLYLDDIFALLNINIIPPTLDSLMYFDAAMVLFGGLVLGYLLRRRGDKKLGWAMMGLNLILTPWFIWRALP
ncbi:hypothetical protein CKK33_08595 [Mucilaginibacter sp. MD40]|uniref:hypothetical protein n=1 Tax=Mucilaginibacter sp. MD40 TaxID=2029590 RepID=UPI000BAC9715|nr:hypothetical protein [Mucilaginibacter sp. MD40]PAW93548.1 hypothetical protein CKK33_08595 [Mucilaginibacter sp. MD40]